MVVATWKSLPAEVEFPVCRLHWLGYFLPMRLTGMSLGHKVVIALACLFFIGGLLGFLRVGLGYEQFAPTPLLNYAICLVPLSAWWLALQLVPVRIADFASPSLWLRIRRADFADAFQRINDTAMRTSSKS
ncbi:MAG: hypothetical protein EON54_02010 [Alcaligenaceae bacterium]|nr:MAG: hypothetical protein EON54_02010 [Alcaligenaceae bacterium]